MIKIGLFITLVFVVASGCGIIDSPAPKVADPVAPKAAAVPDPQVSVREAQEQAPTQMPVPTVAPRILSSDEIRRMQVRLRDVGLDPGPVDGVAGAKTLVAAQRFQSGCAQLHDLLDGNLNPGPGSDKIPGRKATLSLQQRMRSAGFNPGPIDGIFGARMKTLFGHLQNGCPAAQEFAARLNEPDGTEKHTPAAISTGYTGAAKSIVEPSPQEATKPGGALSAAKSREEIRLLQSQLRDAGYDPGPVDGIMGSKTKMALEQMHADQRGGRGKIIVKAGGDAHY